MNDVETGGSSDSFWPAVSDSEDTYRLLDKPKWINDRGEITAAAFRRRVSDGDCLSLGLRGKRSEAQFCEEEPARRSRCVGVAHAKAKKMREKIPDWGIPLAIVQDEKHHACLTGLPEPPESVVTAQENDQEITVEYVGNELAKRMRLIWHKGQLLD